MKKLLNISVIAALAILPVAANAAVGDVIDTNPTNIETAPNPQTAAQVTTDAAPLYKVATVGANDGYAATAGYVKGAYNAAIRAVNTVAQDAAKKVGVEETIKDVTLTSEFSDGSISGTASGNFENATVTGGVTGDVQSTFTGGTVTGDVTSTFTGGTVTGQVSSDFSGSVSVPTTAPSLTEWDDDTSVGTIALTGATSTAVSGTVNSTFTGGAATGTVSSTFSNGSASGTVSSTFSNGAIENGKASGSFSGATVTGTASGTVTTTINPNSVNYTEQ